MRGTGLSSIQRELVWNWVLREVGRRVWGLGRELGGSKYVLAVACAGSQLIGHKTAMVFFGVCVTK